MITLANSEDPDEKLHNVAFHQGLHSLHGPSIQGQRLFAKTILINICFGTCDPSI